MKKIYIVTIIIVALFGGFLRVYPIDFPLSHDEWYTYDILNRNFTDMNVQMYDDVHVPLYFYLARISSSIFGLSEMNLRLLSVVFGILGILVFAKFTLTFFGKRVALLATGILSLSIFHVSYSQIARMYSLLFLLATSSLYFLLSLFFRQKKYTSLGYILSNIAILYTHIFGVFILMFEMVAIFKYRERLKSLREIVFAHLVIFIGALPVWIFICIQILRKIAGTSYGDWMPETKFKDIYLTFSAMSSSDILVYPFLFLFIYFLIRHYFRRNKQNRLYLIESMLIISMIVCFVLPSVITLITPLFAWRYFFIIYPVFILCVSLVLEDIFILNMNVYLVVVFITLILLGLADIVDLNRKNDSIFQQSSCLISTKDKIAEYQKLGATFVTSRWLNEWVPRHRPITGAHKRFQEILGIKTRLINDYNTDLTFLLTDHKYIVNISPSSWGKNFILEDNLRVVDSGGCYGFDYTIYDGGSNLDLK